MAASLGNAESLRVGHGSSMNSLTDNLSMKAANHTNNSGRSNQPDRIESGPVDINNNLAASPNGLNETTNKISTTGNATKHLTNQSNNLSNNLSNNSNNDHQAGDLNGYNESPAALVNQPSQFSNGPASSSEPNSISNSRNSGYPDETNSFSNSVTPDQLNLRADRPVKGRTDTPMTSPIDSPNQPGQSNKKRSNESNEQSQSKSSPQNNGLSLVANENPTGKKIKHYESQLINGIKLPQKRLRLKKIFGYNGLVGDNLHILSTEIAYFVGVFVVLWDPVLNVQRHYSEHTEDIIW